MRVLVACELSGRVRDAFRRHGHDAWSCDLLPLEQAPAHYHAQQFPQHHISGDVLAVLDRGWDLLVGFPPCTYLTVANTYITRGCSKYTPAEAQQLRQDAIHFFLRLANASIAKVAIENPIGIMSKRFREPDQIIQPWMFGDDASKATCLWLRGLPKLTPTNELPGGYTARRANQTASGQNKLGPSPERAMLRALTYPGIAEAMAAQWGTDMPTQPTRGQSKLF